MLWLNAQTNIGTTQEVTSNQKVARRRPIRSVRAPATSWNMNATYRLAERMAPMATVLRPTLSMYRVA